MIDLMANRMNVKRRKTHNRGSPPGMEAHTPRPLKAAWTQHVKLRTLLLGVCIPIVALSVILTGLATELIARRSLEGALVDLAVSRSSDAADVLDGTFRMLQGVPLLNARVIALLPTLDPAFPPRLLEETIKAYPDIYGATVAFDRGAFRPELTTYMPYVYQRVPGSTAAYGIDWVRDYLDPTKQVPGGIHSWYREALERPGLITWTLPYSYPVTLPDGSRIAILMVTVETTIQRNGRVIGVSTSDITLDRLIQYTEGIRVGERGYAILVDRFGHVLTHPRAELRFTPQSKLEEMRLDNPKYGALSAWAERILDPQRRRGPGVVRADAGGMVFRFQEGDQSMLAAATVIPSTGWHLIAVGEEAELFSSLTRLWGTGAALALLAAVAIGGMIWIVLAFAFRPIMRLVKASELITAGRIREAQAELSASAPLSTTYEVERLRKAIGSVTNYITITSELERANMELSESERLREQLLSHVSHELKTPIMVIQHWASSLAEEELGSIGDQQRDAARHILDSAAGLNVLINDLLDLSRIRAGKLVLDLRPVDGGELVQAIVETLRPLSEEKRQRLTTQIEPELPAVLADEQRLAQVLTNLLSNAIKYTPVEGRVGVRLGRDGEYVLFEVEDSGIGIAEEDLPKLFQPFSQVGDRRTRQGTGLGLSISAAIVEAHGSRINVRSHLGRGSHFWFSLRGQ